ncbi:MAG TPA: DUF6491 family protein [Rhodanobacteraceae bacterium]|nr:DUF6491 family protein [Rhodanobacteraceae bacterium]
MKTSGRRTIALLGCGLLALPIAHAGGPDVPAELARYQQFASPPQASAHILRVDNFIYLGTDAQGDKVLAVRTGFNQVYLITVLSCPRLEEASAIRLTSAAGNVHAGTDFVDYGDVTAGHGWQCRIKTIQQVDYKAMVRSGK